MQTETSLGGTGHRKTTDANHGVNSLLEEIELQERSNAGEGRRDWVQWPGSEQA